MKTIKWYLSVTIFLTATLIRDDRQTDSSEMVGGIHPAVFELVTCWTSDTEQPIATEINLDAVSKNRNQFDAASVRINGDWRECPGRNEQGFRRFRIISSDKSVFAVEFQDNDGGTLTSTTMIKFVIETREIRTGGEPRPVSVLRVISVDAR